MNCPYKNQKYFEINNPSCYHYCSEIFSYASCFFSQDKVCVYKRFLTARLLHQPYIPFFPLPNFFFGFLRMTSSSVSLPVSQLLKVCFWWLNYYATLLQVHFCWLNHYKVYQLKNITVLFLPLFFA